MERNQANSGHTQRRAASPEPSTPTQTTPRPSSPGDQGTPEVDANVRYDQHQLCVPLIMDPVRTECSTSTSEPATAARNREEQDQRTTTPQQPTGEPERTQNLSQRTDYSDSATEYSAIATSTRGQTASPDGTKFSTQNTAPSRYRQHSVPTRRATQDNNNNKGQRWP